MGFNNTKYTTGNGTVMPARINILNQTPTDTLVTVTPKHGTTHKINLSGKNSTVQRFTGEGGYVPESNFLDDYSDYWINVARQAYSNKKSYLDLAKEQWNKFKVGVSMKQQGGQLSPEQQELQYALVGYIVATKKQPKDENEIKQLAQQLIQLKQQDPQKYNQLVQLGQKAQAQKAEKGAKLNYIKSLKGLCPDGEELVYFKKGGMIDCGCQKKEKGGEVKQPKKANAIEEFKKGRKSKKC